MKSQQRSILVAVSFLFLALITSCEKEEVARTSFSIKDNPALLEVTAQGTSMTYTVETSGAWKVEPLRNERWLKIESSQGEGNGTFTVTVDRNNTLETRNSTLTFVVDGRVHNNIIRVEQAAGAGGDGNSDAYLHLDGLTSLELPEEGINSRYTVRSTGDWRLEVVEGADWLSVSPMEGKYDTGISLDADVNASETSRVGKIIFYLNEEQIPGEFVVTQAGMEVILFEDFNWLAYGSEIFNSTGGETRMGNWTASELAKGWTGTIPPDGTGSTYVSTYARPGFVKLGRTNYGGDLISPKLAEVEGTKNLQVSFKAVRYAAGDHSLLKVGVIGPGTVSESTFNVTNIASPNSTLEGSRAAWNAPEAKRTFIVTGATSETQIWFFAGEFYMSTDTGWPSNTNRIFIDDVLVAVKK